MVSPNIVQMLYLALYAVFRCIFAGFNKSLHLFPIFLAKYKEMMGGIRLQRCTVFAMCSMLITTTFGHQEVIFLFSPELS